MKIKLMAFDLDNTLFNKEGKIEQSTKDILKKCMDMGVIVTIATGRMYPSAKLIADEIETDAPIICYNGACLQGRKDKEPLMLQTLNKNVQIEIMEYCKVKNLFLQMYNQDKIIVTTHNKYSQSDPDSKNVPVIEVGEFTKENIKPTPKMMIYNDVDVIKSIENELKPKYKGRAYMAQSSLTLLEIMDNSVNKSYALANLAKEYGIKQEEVAAFGDNSNDFEMVEWAGWGVAVSNAIDMLKNVASYVCTEERNKGVEQAIQHLLDNGNI